MSSNARRRYGARMSDFAMRAAEAAETIKARGSTSTDVEIAAIKAVTYALLDVAEAIREHARS